MFPAKFGVALVASVIDGGLPAVVALPDVDVLFPEILFERHFVAKCPFTVL